MSIMDRSVIIAAAKNIRENTELIVNAGNALIKETVEPIPQDTVEKSVKESVLMDKALTSAFNSPEELKSKKLLSAALLIAKKKQLLPAGVPETLGSVLSASISDEAVTKMKTAYQVASGKIDVYEATDAMIDRATARLLAVSDSAVKKGVDYAVKGLELWATASFPPALPVVAMIKNVQPVITNKMQQLVKIGLPKISLLAKKAIRKVGTVIQNKVTSISRNVINLISTI